MTVWETVCEVRTQTGLGVVVAFEWAMAVSENVQ
jgi:hypothetical protein